MTEQEYFNTFFECPHNDCAYVGPSAWIDCAYVGPGVWIDGARRPTVYCRRCGEEFVEC